MTATRKRGEYAKTAARRQEIVDAAVAVFSAAGFHKGSLRDVAERVGISQAGLLHHFPSKSDLLEAVLSWRDEHSIAEMGGPDLAGLDRIRALVELAKYNESTPALVELHVTLSAEATAPDHPVHDYFVRRYAHVLELTQEAFEQAAADGLLRPGVDGGSAARSLIGLMDGLQIQWLLDRSSVDMAAELRRYVQSLVTVNF